MMQERIYKVILGPHISEKATIGLEQRNEYVFHVVPDATKIEVKKAVEDLFKTKVKSVRIVNVKAKTKQFKGVEGKRKGWKKAYVALEADQKLDMGGVQ